VKYCLFIWLTDCICQLR